VDERLVESGDNLALPVCPPPPGDLAIVFEGAWLDLIGLAERVVGCDFGDALSAFDPRDVD